MAEQVYEERESRFRALADEVARLSLWLSRGRLATFFVAFGFAIAAFAADSGRWTFASFAGVGAAGFLVLVGLHDRIEQRQQLLSTLARLNREQRARVRRRWPEVPHVPAAAAGEHHPFAGDLDLIGRASLLDLLGTVATPRGIDVLRSWLLAPARGDTIRKRQAAVAELAPLLDYRQDLLAHARLASGASGDDAAVLLDRFLTWAEGRPWLLRQPPLVWLTRLLGAAGVTSAAAHATGVVAEPVWLLPVLLNVTLWFVLARRIDRTFDHAFCRGNAPRSDARMFAVACGRLFEADLLAGLRAAAADAERAMLRLQRLMELADIRLTTLFHFPLNALTLWDFHVLYALERWQVRRGPHVRAWFEGVGALEALSALAALRHDEPRWALPEFTEDPVIDARGLGHPLIPDEVRVVNDVRVGPPGTFLFVTGSNMSGKSTLLRAIGVNVVLAQAGGPVCATSMRLPALRVETSMRVQDSLEEGVSYFMAALRRLKDVLEAARSAQAEGDVVVLYLLDELLQGTNTAERQIAVRTVLKQLLASRAIGAITSHDLNLADAEDLRAAAVPVHFTEHFEERPDGSTAMTFDYRLRKGVATSRNALKLMRLIGIES